MLSVILYGRNDSHGYNLHRRAALSLNCIAEALTAPDDEIVFVDYNTPDELPTFPEAIDDCLTDRAKDLLRIVRVRPEWHLPLSFSTRLAALEPQSRNIAIRRCNPANRWILSTNTDMIFIPTAPLASLSDAVAGLEDGFYHLPRLELPEGFWERLDRRDSKAALADISASGPRFHLDEIVYGGYDNLYEAPGDFQLFLREDLFAIDGFDERMILGWHVDANIARRMRLLRGEVRSAAAGLRGYHCGHSRQPTPLHAENRTQNDLRLFVEAVDDPGCPTQRDSWGAPDVSFEEQRLDGSIVRTYRRALAAATSEPQLEDYSVGYNSKTFGNPVLNGRHALTHLCDLLFNMPDGEKIFVLASDSAIVHGLPAFLAIAAPKASVLFASDHAAPAKASFEAPSANVKWMTMDEALLEADVFVLQYPSADEPLSDALRDLQWLAQSVFHRIADAEFQRAPAERRRVITVNAVHSPMEKVVVSTISHAAAPFTTRLRQGFVQERFDRRRTLDPSEAVFEETGRLRPYTPTERALLGRVVDSLEGGGKAAAGWQRVAPELRALAQHPQGAARILGRPLVDPAALESKAVEVLEGARRRAAGLVEWVGGRPATLTRLISGQDWENAAWLAFAERFFAQESLYDLTHRSRWIWERVSLTMALQGVLDHHVRPWVLFLSSAPDVMPLLLANSGFRVAYSTVDDFMAGRPVKVRDWVKLAVDAGIRVITPSDLRPLDEVMETVREAGGFSALSAPVGVVFEGGGLWTDRLLGLAAPLMGDGAVLACGAHVHLNASVEGGAISQMEWRNLFHPMGPLGSRGFSSVEPPDERTPADTAVRFAFEDKAEETIGGLSFGFGAGFVAPAIVTARWPKSLTPGATREAAITALTPPEPLKVEAASAKPMAVDDAGRKPKAAAKRPAPPSGRAPKAGASKRPNVKARVSASPDPTRRVASLAAPPPPAGSLPAALVRAAPAFTPGVNGLRNLQPFVTAGPARIARTPVGVQIVGEAPLRLSVRLDLGAAETARFKIRLDAEPVNVRWEPDEGRVLKLQPQAEPGAVILEIASVSALGLGTLVIELAVAQARIAQFVSL